MSSVENELDNQLHRRKPTRFKLGFDPSTGKLRVCPGDCQGVNVVCTEMSPNGFFGGYCYTSSEGNKIEIRSKSLDESKTIHVETVHISCKSDPFCGNGYNYAGVIIYQCHGLSEWRTANGTHCKTGYLVIQDTDSKEVKRWKDKTAGQVHGAVYRNAFGEAADTSKVVAEGFSIMRGSFKINSGVFNNPAGSQYHDYRRRMSEISEGCVKKVVESWKSAGPRTLGCRNFSVKDLLKDR